MRINCPQCGFFRELPDTKAPVTPTMATCPKCRHRFRFRPEPAPAAPASHFPLGEEGVSSWRRGSPTKQDRQQPPSSAWEPANGAEEEAGPGLIEEPVLPDDVLISPTKATTRSQTSGSRPADALEQTQWPDVAGNESADDDDLATPSHWAQTVEPEQPSLRRPLDPKPPVRARARSAAAAPAQPVEPPRVAAVDEPPARPVVNEPAAAAPRAPEPAPQPERAARRDMPPAAPEISIPTATPERSRLQPTSEPLPPAQPAAAQPEPVAPTPGPVPPVDAAEPEPVPPVVAPQSSPVPPVGAPQTEPVRPGSTQTPEATGALPPIPETSKPVEAADPPPRVDGVRDIWARLQAMDVNRSKKRRAEHQRPAEDDPEAPPRETVVDPIPWERQDAYGFFPGLFLTLKKILLQPMEFFGSLPEGRPKSKALVFSLLISEFLLVIDFLWSLMNLRVRVGGPTQQDALHAMGNSPSLYFLGALLLVPAALAAGIYIDAWFTHLLLLLFRSNKKGFNETFRVLCYSSAPTVLSAVPVAGQLLSPIILIWYMALQAIGLKKCHEGAYTQTLAAIFIKWSIYLFLTLAVLQSFTPGQ